MEKQLGVLRILMPEPSKMSKCLLATNSILQLTEATQTLFGRVSKLAYPVHQAGLS